MASVSPEPARAACKPTRRSGVEFRGIAFLLTLTERFLPVVRDWLRPGRPTLRGVAP